MTELKINELNKTNGGTGIEVSLAIGAAAYAVYEAGKDFGHTLYHWWND